MTKSDVFDAIGNRITSVDGDGERGYVVNTVNQYTAITNTSGDASLQYDADGNLTHMSGGGALEWILDWDGENRLIGAETPGNGGTEAARRVEFGYDWQGRRAWKKVFSGAPGGWTWTGTTRWVYEGWRVQAEYNLPAGRVDVQAGDAPVRTYGWGIDLSGTMEGAGGIGGLLVVNQKTGGQTGEYAVAYDHNGNVRGLVNTATGAAAAEYRYDAFGRELSATGTMAQQNPVRFSTKWADAETGWVYYGYRYYAPELGRWVNRDPIGEEGGNALYVIITNTGQNGFDPNGLIALWLDVGGIGIPSQLNTSSAKWHDRTEKLLKNHFTNIDLLLKELSEATDDQFQDAVRGGRTEFNGHAIADPSKARFKATILREKESQALYQSDGGYATAVNKMRELLRKATEPYDEVMMSAEGIKNKPGYFLFQSEVIKKARWKDDIALINKKIQLCACGFSRSTEYVSIGWRDNQWPSAAFRSVENGVPVFCGAKFFSIKTFCD